MRLTEINLVIISGLCFLPACFPHDYILVKQPLTFPEALSYCRYKYTDMAVVRNELDFAKFSKIVMARMTVWIGLRPDTESWRWSLDDQDHHGEGEAGFKMWNASQPNGFNLYKSCVVMLKRGVWFDHTCSSSLPFVCYSKSKSSFVYVNESKTWAKAQSYCRNKHTDLASVRNPAESEQVKGLNIPFAFWIGLYRDAWKWSDGRVYSFDNWTPRFPAGSIHNICVGSVRRQWVNFNCGKKLHFVCYQDVKEKKVVKLVLQKSNSSVDEDELQKRMLGRFKGRVKELGLEDEINVSWMKQSDGKIFHESTEEEEEEENSESCPMK